MPVYMCLYPSHHCISVSDAWVATPAGAADDAGPAAGAMRASKCLHERWAGCTSYQIKHHKIVYFI